MRRLAPLLSNPAAFRRSTDMIPSILGGMMLPYRGQLTTVGNILDVSSGSHVALFASGFSPRGQSNRFSGGREGNRGIRASSVGGRGAGGRGAGGRGAGRRGGRYDGENHSAGRFGSAFHHAQRAAPSRQVARRGTSFEGSTYGSDFQSGGGRGARGSRPSGRFNANFENRSGGRSGGRGPPRNRMSNDRTFERNAEDSVPPWKSREQSPSYQRREGRDSNRQAYDRGGSGSSWQDRGGPRESGRERGRGRGRGGGRSPPYASERQVSPAYRSGGEASWDDTSSDGGWQQRSKRFTSPSGDRAEQWQPDRVLNSQKWQNSAEEKGPLTITKEAWKGDALYGIAPVLAALAAGRRDLHALYVQEGHLEGSSGGPKSAIQEAVKAAKSAGITVSALSKHDLNMLSDNRPHQGLVLDASALEWEELDRLPDATQISAAGGRPPVWLALDEVQDPMNFGAALRSAHFLGVGGLLTCSRNAAPLSPTTSKASAGAMEVMAVHSAKNLPRTLAAAEADGWLVIGASAEVHATDVCDITLDRPTILVVGGEGAGLRTNVKKACSQLVRIDGADTTSNPDASGLAVSGHMDRGLVDSLNLSVATGIILHRFMSSGGTTSENASSHSVATAGNTNPATESKQNDANPEDARVHLTQPVALGEGLAAIALADEIYDSTATLTVEISGRSSEP